MLLIDLPAILHPMLVSDPLVTFGPMVLIDPLVRFSPLKLLIDLLATLKAMLLIGPTGTLGLTLLTDPLATFPPLGGRPARGRARMAPNLLCNNGQAGKGGQVEHDYWVQVASHKRSYGQARKEDQLKHGYGAQLTDQESKDGRAKLLDHLKRDYWARATDRGCSPAKMEDTLRRDYRAKITDQVKMEDTLKRDYWAEVTDQKYSDGQERMDDALNRDHRAKVTGQVYGGLMKYEHRARVMGRGCSGDQAEAVDRLKHGCWARVVGRERDLGQAKTKDQLNCRTRRATAARGPASRVGGVARCIARGSARPSGARTLRWYCDRWRLVAALRVGYLPPFGGAFLASAPMRTWCCGPVADSTEPAKVAVGLIRRFS